MTCREGGAICSNQGNKGEFIDPFGYYASCPRVSHFLARFLFPTLSYFDSFLFIPGGPLTSARTRPPFTVPELAIHLSLPLTELTPCASAGFAQHRTWGQLGFPEEVRACAILGVMGLHPHSIACVTRSFVTCDRCPVYLVHASSFRRPTTSQFFPIVPFLFSSTI
jgi:hypothetical protein